MASFDLELPDEIMKDFENIQKNTEEIFGAMTRAGARVVEGNIKSTVPLQEMAQHVHTSKTYKTPTDGGINTKVYLSGYLPFRGNRKTFSRSGHAGGRVYVTTKGIPVSFLANIYEYGRSGNPFPKKPFLRKAFKSEQIERAMLEEQRKASGGLLE